MNGFNFTETPHRRFNPLTGEWVLVSPQRTKRPWQGKLEFSSQISLPKHDPGCYLCPNNKRAGGKVNPPYNRTFVFNNDFSALKLNAGNEGLNRDDILIARYESGICRVLCFSPRHDLTLAEMSESDIGSVIDLWTDEFETLSKKKEINHIQIFENKGEIMGCSNPHPHGQIWAQYSIPVETSKEIFNMKKYFDDKGKTLLEDYIDLEMMLNERIVCENDTFVVVVPFWAVWPFETMIIPKRRLRNIITLSDKEKKDFAQSIKCLTVKYDNLFKVSFPYSSGIHQAPTDGSKHEYFHMHMHFYPPLLRSSSVKKFMVGYEMLAEAQRDMSPELSAELLKEASDVHYKEGIFYKGRISPK